MFVEYVYLDKKGMRIKGIMIILSYVIGLISIFLLNIFRIAFIILLALTLGYNASELFHSFGYEFIFFVWIIFYIYIFEYLVYRKGVNLTCQDPDKILSVMKFVRSSGENKELFLRIRALYSSKGILIC